jgi:riboflavin biosynthesis pyrimidine reductase
MDTFGNGCAHLAFQAWPYRAIHIAISHMLNAMQRLFPNPVASLTVADAYGVTRTRIEVGSGKSRPTIGVCMVHSIDGSTVVEGNSRALGSPGDLAVLLGLRALADVIIVGSSTVTIDDYGPPSKPGLRVGVVTRSANIDATKPLFSSGSGFLITTETAATPAGVECVRAGTTEVNLAEAVTQLQGNFAQLEGGPTLNAAMLAADLVDEINVTISAHMVGGNGPRLTNGAPDVLKRYKLAHVCEEDGFLFLRYTR